MSTTIDERIVSMKFNNRDFEQNVATSLSTLERLKSSLSFSGLGKSFSEIGNSIKGVDVGPLGDAVDTVKNRFSALEVVAVTALANITNSIVNTGKQMLESLTIEPIKEGFNEYELKMGSVQTIMAGIGADFADPEALAMVTDKLQELNEYADKTIYSFSDMTASIGKFTNAGVDLDKAVAAIKGISNEAAVSGANANEASRAMYNFAQALSAGSVKLIDWKSIENANMATVEFKQALIDTAVNAGTLAKNLDGTYTVLTENNQGTLMDDVISATQNFNDSLQYQWMTSDVLIDTLGRYANAEDELGKKAFDAAQDVKTFSQLMDTLKEAVGSGWASTWEIVFGDFHESKKLWTDINDVVSKFIDNQSKARNDLLQTWKDLGGRASLIEGFKNSISGFSTILGAIKDAYREIFPPLTGEKLAYLSEQFKNLTEKMQLGGDHLKQTKNIFSGFFSVVDIAIGVISHLVSVVWPLLNKATPLLDDVLSRLSDLGKKITDNRMEIEKFINLKIDKGLAEILDVFSKYAPVIKEYFSELENSVREAIDEYAPVIKEYFLKLKDSIHEAVDDIKNSFSGFKDVDFSGFDEFASKVSDRLHPLTFLFDIIKKIFGGIATFLLNVFPSISTVLTKLSDFIKDAFSKIGEALGGVEYVRLSDIINSGALLAFFLALQKVFRDLAGSGTHITKSLKTVTKILNELKGVLEAYQQQLKAKVLLEIAAAIALLSGSIIALSLVDSKKLTTAIVAMGAILVLVTKSMGSLFGLLDKMNPKKFLIMQAEGIFLVELAGAIALITEAVIRLSTLNWDGLLRGLGGMAVLLLEISLFVNNTKFNNIKLRNALGIIAVSEALKIMADAITQIGSLDIKELGIGLLGISGALLAISLFVNNTKFDGINLMDFVGIYILAQAISTLSESVSVLSSINIEDMIQGLVGFGVVLQGINLFLKNSNLSELGITSAVSLVLLAASIEIMAQAIRQLGDLNIAELAKGLGGFTVLLVELAAFTEVMNTSNFGVGSGASLILLATALTVLMIPIKQFGEMSIEGIAKGLTTLAGAIVLLALASHIMNDNVGAAASFTIMAVGVAIMADALSTVGQLSIGEIAKSFIVLAGALGILAVAAFGLEKLGMIKSIKTLGVALSFVGTGLSLIGSGILLISAGLPALLSGGTVAIGALTAMLTELIGLIPTVAIALADGLVEMVVAFSEQIGKIADAFKNIILTVIGVIKDLLPEVVEMVLTFIDEVLKKLADHIPSMITSIIDIILGIIVGISEKMADIMQAVWDLVVNIIDGIAAAFGNEDNVRRLRDAIINLGKSILEAILVFFGIHSPSTVFQEIGWNLIEGLIVGIGDMIAAAGEKIRELGEHLLEKIREKLDAFRQKGTEIMDNVKSGIDNAKESVKTAFNNIIDALKNVDDKVKGFVDSGKNLILGFKKGIEDGTIRDQLMASVGTVFGAVRDRIAGIFQENSPSKVTFGFGRYVVEGFANGMRAYADMALDAADEFGLGTLDGIQSAVSKIADLVENGIDTDPTIRPVMDLSNVNSGIRDLNSMIDSSTSMSLAASANFDMNRMVSRNQNGVVVNNSDVIKAITNLKDNLADVFNGSDDGLNVNNSDVIGAISDLKDRISEMNSMLQGLNIVLDTGTLVGELSQPMDRAFGRMATLNERGVS